MLAAQRPVQESELYRNAKDEEKAAVLAAGATELLAQLRSKTPLEPVTVQDVDAAIVRYKDVVLAEIKTEWVPVVTEFEPIADALAELAIRELMTHYDQYLAKTGIVIGG